MRNSVPIHDSSVALAALLPSYRRLAPVAEGDSLMKPVLSLLLLESVLLTSVIDTSQWSPASSDPSGLTYLATSRRLVVVDGEVDETRVFGGSTSS